MKRLILGITVAMTLCTLAHGVNRTVTENDSLGNKKRVIELKDTVINGIAVTDTLSIMTYENSPSSNGNSENWKHHRSKGFEWGDFDFNDHVSTTIIAVVGIVFGLGLPMLIVFTVFFFRYKNRKAQYRLAEQALANGQQLPENFFKNAETQSIHSKGIKNIFTGTGLFIFFWAITGEFGLGCIGLLIMFTGFGQLVIYYSQQKKSDK